MRLNSLESPLIFRFPRADDLLDAINMAKQMNYRLQFTVYEMQDYYLLLYPPVSTRIKLRIHLSEYGRLCGHGRLTRAILDEHGTLRADFSSPALKEQRV